MTSPGYFLDPDLYDLVYAGFVADIGVMRDEAKAAGGATLEVACGTGRLLIPMREEGLDVEGLDLDVPMLDTLRAKLAERDMAAVVHHADMRSFDLPRRFALVIIGFNSFLHNLTQEDQLRTLRRVRHHLAQGGHLALMCFHPSAQRLAGTDPTPKLAIDVALPDGRRVRTYDGVSPDRVQQVNRVTRRIEVLDATGELVQTQELEFPLRYIYTPEMELLLRVAGFGRTEVCSPIASYSGERYAEPRPAEDGGIHLWRAWEA